jgi:hypothetical protein
MYKVTHWKAAYELYSPFECTHGTVIYIVFPYKYTRGYYGYSLLCHVCRRFSTYFTSFFHNAKCI